MNQIDTETQGKVRGTRFLRISHKAKIGDLPGWGCYSQFPRGETVGLRITSA